MANVRQLSFAKGEIAPALYARTDQAAYATGLRTCRNFIVQRTGGVTNRPGTELVGPCIVGTITRLLPFEFNNDQTYVLEFSDHLIRFIRDGAYVLSTGTPYSIACPYSQSELFELQIAQSADVVTITHKNHPTADLARFADNSWTYTPKTFAPAISAPTGVAVNDATHASSQWVVTAVDEKTGQESYPSTSVGGTFNVANRLSYQPRQITWTAVSGASSYNVYKGQYDGTVRTDLGFVGSTSLPVFYDNATNPDMLNRAPVARNPFSGSGTYAGAVTYCQGRLVLGGSTSEPSTVWTSRSADYNNFTVSSPSQDDDALTLTLVSDKVPAVQHLIEHGSLLAFTSVGEFAIQGDVNDILRPTDLVPRRFSTHGSSLLAPISIDTRVLYVQARQSIVRDIIKDPFYGYKGSDLTVLSSHLFDGHTLVDWAYQEVPHSVVWCVRDDGVLLGLTDMAEQQILAWHRHDTTNGTFESVCVIPEGNEDAVYVVVNRNGKRYVERFASRFFENVEDAILTDATLTYDGRNTNALKSMTLTGGTEWSYDEVLTLTCSLAEFAAGDVGNQIFLTGSDGSVIRFTIGAFSSSLVVTGFAQKTVPTALQGIGTSTWSRAVDVVTGLQHLEGQAVSIFADGFVVSSPNNPAIDTKIVGGGTVQLDKPYAVIHVGLPITSDFETLDIDRPEGPSMKERKSLINRLGLEVYESRGVFAGSTEPTDAGTGGLIEYKARQSETYGQPVSLATDTIQINVLAEWNSRGRVFVRQVDPVPLTILAAIPTGYLPI